MIERIDTGTRSSKIVKYNGVVYLTGQVAEGDTIQEQVRSCLENVCESRSQIGPRKRPDNLTVAE